MKANTRQASVIRQGAGGRGTGGYHHTQRRSEMSYYCPQCHGVIYDRASGNCAVCGAQLSEGSFLSPAGIERMRRETEETEAGHKRDSGELEAEEQKRRDRRAS